MTTNRLDWEVRRLLIISVGSFLGLFIGGIICPKEGAAGPLYILGPTALGMAAAFVASLVFNPKPKGKAPAGTTTEAAPAAPELDRQVSDILNSGKEPSLIVEELRQLTNGR